MGNILIVLLVLYLAEKAVEQYLALINLGYLARHGGKVPPGFEKHVDGDKLMERWPVEGWIEVDIPESEKEIFWRV